MVPSKWASEQVGKWGGDGAGESKAAGMSGVELSFVLACMHAGRHDATAACCRACYLGLTSERRF